MEQQEIAEKAARLQVLANEMNGLVQDLNEAGCRVEMRPTIGSNPGSISVDVWQSIGKPPSDFALHLGRPRPR